MRFVRLVQDQAEGVCRAGANRPGVLSMTTEVLVPCMESGSTYESTYGGWLTYFERVATSASPALCSSVPASWVPFLKYLGATVLDSVVHFDVCLLYTSDAADERSSVDLGGRRWPPRTG